MDPTQDNAVTTGGTKMDEAWITKQKKRIKEVFELFDKDKRGCVIIDEVRTIMQALDIYPTETAFVKDIIPEITGDVTTAPVYATYKRLEAKILTFMETKEWDPDTDDMLMQAFRTIDTEELGYITSIRLEELLSKKGTPFSKPEVDTFLRDVKDLETGFVYYEDYVAMMTQEANQLGK